MPLTAQTKIIKTPILIAEVGNNHEGNFDLACEMLERAKDAGADLVKFQAGKAEGFARRPEQIEFYRKLELSLEDFTNLYKLGQKIGIEVFFSIWSPEMESLRKLEKYHKIPARQCTSENINLHDSPNTFISMPPEVKVLDFKKPLQGFLLHVIPEYPTYDPNLEMIFHLTRMVGNKVGFSDHTIGISTAIVAIKEFHAVAVEKHFTLTELKQDSNFRDHQLSATPEEFKILRDIVKE